MKSVQIVLVFVTASIAQAGSVQAAGPSAGADAPVRISREFFANSFDQNIRVKAAGDARDYEGRGSWEEYETTLPPPAPTEETGEVLADFRDFKACARSQGVGLCFNVMPDVSSVGMNAREMSMEGADSFVPSGCEGAARSLAFSRAIRTAGGYTAVFVSSDASGDPSGDPTCSLQIEVTLASGAAAETL